DSSVQRRVPAELARQRERSRVDQELRRVAAVAFGGLIRPVNWMPVQGTDAAELCGQEAVPDVAGARRQREPCALATVRVEEAQLDAVSDRGKNSKVRAVCAPGRARGVR